MFERGDTRQAELTRMAKAQSQGGRRDLGEARARSADQVARRTGDARLDRREGDRQGRRAPAGRRRVRQSPAEAHEAAVRSDDRLRPRVRQGHARPSDHQGRARSGDALQHLHHRRPAAGADLQSRQGGAGGGRQPARTQGSLFRRRRHRRPRVRRDARPASQERRALAPDREGRQGQARARRDADARSAPTPAKHSALDDVDPAIFGAVALGDAPVDSGPLATRLGKLAESRRHRGRSARSWRRPVGERRRRRPASTRSAPSSPASTTSRRRRRSPTIQGPTTPRSRSPRSRFRRRRSPTRRRASPVTATPAPPIRASPGSTRPPARRRGRAPSTPPRARRSIRCSTRPTISTRPRGAGVRRYEAIRFRSASSPRRRSPERSRRRWRR